MLPPSSVLSISFETYRFYIEFLIFVPAEGHAPTYNKNFAISAELGYRLLKYRPVCRCPGATLLRPQARKQLPRLKTGGLRFRLNRGVFLGSGALPKPSCPPGPCQGSAILQRGIIANFFRFPLTRFIHEGLRRLPSQGFFEAEKSRSWAERRWKKPQSDIPGQYPFLRGGSRLTLGTTIPVPHPVFWTQVFLKPPWQSSVLASWLGPAMGFDSRFFSPATPGCRCARSA